MWRRRRPRPSPREITAAGGVALPFAASVTDEAAVAAMVARTIAEWGRVDILVNNAGILRDKSFAKMSLDDFRLVVDVHLMGAVDLHQGRVGAACASSVTAASS